MYKCILQDFTTRLNNYIKLYRIRHSLGAVCLRHYILHSRVRVSVLTPLRKTSYIFRWARGGSNRACTLARIPCTTVPSTKATQNATQVVALSTLAGPPGPSRSCYVLRVRVFDDHWRPLATTGDQWRGCSVRAHTLPGTTTLLEHPIRLRRTKVERGCLL